jgi:hypothetical protein
MAAPVGFFSVGFLPSAYYLVGFLFFGRHLYSVGFFPVG